MLTEEQKKDYLQRINVAKDPVKAYELSKELKRKAEAPDPAV